jgi:hypothetical protein
MLLSLSLSEDQPDSMDKTRKPLKSRTQKEEKRVISFVTDVKKKRAGRGKRRMPGTHS